MTLEYSMMTIILTSVTTYFVIHDFIIGALMCSVLTTVNVVLFIIDAGDDPDPDPNSHHTMD